MLQKLEELVWPTSWAEVEAFAQEVDRVECPIDEGILEAVVAFNFLNAGVGEGGSANSGKIYMQNDGYNDLTREILHRICYELVSLW